MGSVSFKGGLEVEDRVMTILKAYGCELVSNATLNHQEKLDFVLQTLPENSAFHTIGVQVTTNISNADKMNEFYSINKECRLKHRSLYLELADGVDLERGGGLAVLLVLGEFALNRRMQDTKISGVRVFNDSTYEFFDLEQKIQELRRPEFKSAIAQATIAVPTPIAVQAKMSPPGNKELSDRQATREDQHSSSAYP